ncbi:Tim10/DDP family zinc finger-domain-containing protein [Lipomyces arxii]|uniref:Tim10/DDP family zinc finger-domain-containing protein n=1 Tax=Lipomyces arxii TaxID=56418 RepID=UPI0034CF0B4D
MAFSLFGGNKSDSSTPPTPSEFVADNNDLVSSSPDVAALKQKIRTQISQEMALANANELINKIASNCYEKCIVTAGPSLTAGDQKCLDMCTEKYFHAWNLISRLYTTRLQQERKN